jgi:hypothetical protein
MVFSTSSKKPYTPREWAGTRQRAVFAVRNQHTVQVKPVEGAAPGPFLFWFFCGYAAKKPEQTHFSGVCNPQSPAWQSGKPLSFMRMG